MTKIAGSESASGSGSISQRHGSADPYPDPDPPQNVMDPQHWYALSIFTGKAEVGVLNEPDSAKPTQLSSHTGLPGYKGRTRFQPM
jgi:hypothetical protein